MRHRIVEWMCVVCKQYTHAARPDDWRAAKYVCRHCRDLCDRQDAVAVVLEYPTGFLDDLKEYLVFEDAVQHRMVVLEQLATDYWGQRDLIAVFMPEQWLVQQKDLDQRRFQLFLAACGIRSIRTRDLDREWYRGYGLECLLPMRKLKGEDRMSLPWSRTYASNWGGMAY